MNKDIWQALRAHQTLQEQPFRSHAPLVGPLIAWLRDQWNSVATKWYVRPLIARQNAFNGAATAALDDIDRRLVEAAAVSDEQQIWLIAQDRQLTALAHDLSELTAQLAQRNRQLAELSARVARLEAALNPNHPML